MPQALCLVALQGQESRVMKDHLTDQQLAKIGRHAVDCGQELKAFRGTTFPRQVESIVCECGWSLGTRKIRRDLFVCADCGRRPCAGHLIKKGTPPPRLPAEKSARTISACPSPPVPATPTSKS